MSGKYSKILLFWSLLFIVSVFIAIIGWNRLELALDGRPPEPEDTQISLNIILGVVSAITSAGGFIVTTYFALREDKRDKSMHDLQIEKLKREIEEKDLELERLRKQEPPP
ncbi:MAG: hypothetical protein KDE48_21750 [Anaerolineales bacterium]|nr:hypothetical protein [Anaerolineales bacterium]